MYYIVYRSKRNFLKNIYLHYKFHCDIFYESKVIQKYRVNSQSSPRVDPRASLETKCQYRCVSRLRCYR